MTSRCTNLHYFSSLPLRCGVLVTPAKTTRRVSPFPTSFPSLETVRKLSLASRKSVESNPSPSFPPPHFRDRQSEERSVSVRNRAFPPSTFVIRDTTFVRKTKRVANNNGGSPFLDRSTRHLCVRPCLRPRLKLQVRGTTSIGKEEGGGERRGREGNALKVSLLFLFPLKLRCNVRRRGSRQEGVIARSLKRVRDDGLKINFSALSLRSSSGVVRATISGKPAFVNETSSKSKPASQPASL